MKANTFACTLVKTKDARYFSAESMSQKNDDDGYYIIIDIMNTEIDLDPDSFKDDEKIHLVDSNGFWKILGLSEVDYG